MPSRRPVKPDRKEQAALRWARLQGQFRGLDMQDPSGWPALPRYALLALIAVFVIGFLWYA